MQIGINSYMYRFVYKNNKEYITGKTIMLPVFVKQCSRRISLSSLVIHIECIVLVHLHIKPGFSISLIKP